MADAFYHELVHKIIEGHLDLDASLKLRRTLARRHGPRTFPSIIQILLHATPEQLPQLAHLITKPMRTQSGVAPVAIMTMPRRCPHGTCTFCPGGPQSFFGDVPQSYTGNEPASLRAARNRYDAYLQVFNRLEQFSLLNQPMDKAELIVMGGTFPSYPQDYQDLFVRDALQAMNDYGALFYPHSLLDFAAFKAFFELPTTDLHDPQRTQRIQERILALKTDTSLDEEQARNETSKVRCTALCVETKPDWCYEPHLDQALRLGATRVELGVQTLSEAVLKKANRGHTVRDTVTATQLLKDSFLKCVYHLMPGLPDSTRTMDINVFKEIFSNPDYQPDGLKIYPCMVMPGTPLYEQYKKGQFVPLTTEDAAEIVAEGKTFIPDYCRVYRCQRDIPTKVTVDGVNITNFRQYVQDLMRKKGLRCRCIRCREPKGTIVDWSAATLHRRDYEASGGHETFLSYDDPEQDLLLGFLRLRIPSRPFRKEITERSAGIREVHVYGKALSLGSTEEAVQHRGVGRLLLEEAERISREEFDRNKMLVIAGIGVREYFRRKHGYAQDGVYVSKRLG